MTNSQISDLKADEKTATEARIVTLTICVALEFKPTEEQVASALAQLVRVATEGMKMQVVSAQSLVLTVEQARKAFEKAEMMEAMSESKQATRQ